MSIRFRSDSSYKRSLRRRVLIVHAALFVVLLVIVSRLLELQIVKGAEFRSLAQAQHFAGVKLPAKRGEILSRNSKTGETSVLATNTTLALVYVDPVITDDSAFVAEMLADLLVTEEAHALCKRGDVVCPRELAGYYSIAFDPLERMGRLGSGALSAIPPAGGSPVPEEELPDLTEVRRQFARNIEERISEKRVTFVPLKYGATKVQMQAVEDAGIDGIGVAWNARLIFANPERVRQLQAGKIARTMAEILDEDADAIKRSVLSRPLRYVPVMRQLPPDISSKIREAQLLSYRRAEQERAASPSRDAAQTIADPLRSVALIPEHWRFYPDSTIGTHVVGFLNTNQEPQYGIEQTFDPALKGQEGRISTLSDPQGGQIMSAEQEIIDPKDGDTIVLTIDRVIQKFIEGVMERAVREYESDSGQVIVLDPFSGRIIAMVNAPLFDSNNYGTVYDKDPLLLTEKQRQGVVVEIYDPATNQFVLKAYIDDVFAEGGRAALSAETVLKLDELESLYELTDITRHYLYIGENNRREIFPTDRRDVWLQYRNNIGVGAYLNRAIQEIYEPGSVMKPVTMSIALDQGEVTPTDIYDDKGPVEVDEYLIKNNQNAVYGKVTMTNCLEFSINTCMTSVSGKLGKKLFHRMIERFGFGRVTGIELEDELPGEVLPWRKWSNALLATAAYGQGISATPLQVIAAYGALANGGKLMKPTIIDRIIQADGTVQATLAQVVDQVITREASATITAMLTSSVSKGFAKPAKVPGYRIAGKTGTSQIAGPGGRYETGTGSTIASFAGYAPIDHPKFVILVKFDRPRAKDIIHGSQAAAPVFKEIAAFLFDYYGIPPDET